MAQFPQLKMVCQQTHWCQELQVTSHIVDKMAIEILPTVQMLITKSDKGSDANTHYGQVQVILE